MESCKRGKPYFLVMAVIISIALAILYAGRRVRRNFSFYWSWDYRVLVYLFLVLGFIMIAFTVFSRMSAVRKRIESILRYVYFAVFFPLGLFPLLRCYFKVPYIFCRSCPSPCPWGIMRAAFMPSFLVMNLYRRYWCYRLCPFGFVQDHQCMAVKIRLKPPKWLVLIRYVALAFVLAGIIGAIYFPGLTGFFFRAEFNLYLWTLIVSIIIFALSFFIPRFWCNYFCPIGSFSDLCLALERRLFKNERRQRDSKKGHL